MDSRKHQSPSNNSSTYMTYLRSLTTARGAVSHEKTDLALEKKVTPDAVKMALIAAQESKPHVYNVINHPQRKLNICVFGCQGSEKDAPKQVAALIDHIAEKQPELKPDLFIILGDNFYPDGVPSPDDPRFETQFHGVYGNPILTNIHGTACIVVLGNHDGGRDTETYLKSFVPFHNTLLRTNPLSNEQAEIQQIAHSMLAHASDPNLNESKSDFFERSHLDYPLLPKHLMPHFFHSWIFDQLQIFALNSNTYAKDFLYSLKSYALDDPVDPYNQAVWIKQQYDEAIKQKKSTLFAMHHPLFALGKRAYPSGWDAKHYLKPKEITLLNHILTLSPDNKNFKEQLIHLFTENDDTTKLETNANYNEILRKIFYQFQKMSPNIVCTAHDHAIYYYNNNNDLTPEPKLCQVVSGGGGNEELQHRLFFGQQENLGCFLRNHGCAILSCDPQHPVIFNINIFSVDGKHLQFTSQDNVPYRMVENDNRTKKIREIVLSACVKYQLFLDEKQMLAKPIGSFFNIFSNLTHLIKNNQPHKLKDVDCMHDMINFFNQPIPATYEETIGTLYTLMNSLSNVDSDYSLYRDINTSIHKELDGKSIDILYSELISAFTPH
ncbi:MAG: metallophosphoesterase [Gammaproteobacteria bacterium]|nr:metallophosphoesterase [Gammaproteobacteria bacterium]MCW5582337.1 metallophosphoesterase [Gammaproteobacteria bacterium]